MGKKLGKGLIGIAFVTGAYFSGVELYDEVSVTEEISRLNVLEADGIQINERKEALDLVQEVLEDSYSGVEPHHAGFILDHLEGYKPSEVLKIAETIEKTRSGDIATDLDFLETHLDVMGDLHLTPDEGNLLFEVAYKEWKRSFSQNSYKAYATGYAKHLFDK